MYLRVHKTSAFLKLFKSVKPLHLFSKPTINGFKCVVRFSSTEQCTIRNVGIVAHIDAGKTTTTERMLYYSNCIDYMGEVHNGDTVTDYLPQERERGITITSAAISFPWRKHKINLLDTPGHVDFTVEVERCLSVADGCVVILDAAAGVEVQTLTVWKQADKSKLPRVVYLNKMDKNKASIHLCLNSIQKLGVKALLLQEPLYECDRFFGIVDILTMQKYIWNSKDGKDFVVTAVDKEKDKQLFERLIVQRENLIGFLSEHDEKLSELILSSDDIFSVPYQEVVKALRTVTLENKAVPVLVGSSYKNIGVQLLMDALISYLPSPLDVPNHLASFYKENVCAYVFKIVYNKIFGPLTFVRLYSGMLKPSMKIYNINKERYEKINRLYIPFADEYREAAEITPGNIAAVSGLDLAYTGDTLTSSSEAVERVKEKYSKDTGVDVNECCPVLAGVVSPEPVFFCSIEAPSLSKQKQLEKALEHLQREDPSFKVTVNPDSGQTIISGMGHLHMEIIRDRILREYNVDVYLGTVRVSYRESISDVIEETLSLEKTVGGIRNSINIGVRIKPREGKGTPKRIKIPYVKDPDSDLNNIRPDRLKAVEHGMKQALVRGPILGFPVIDVEIELTELKVSFTSTNTMVSAVASQCILSALKKASSFLLEPVMSVEASCLSLYSKNLLSSLSLKGSQIQSMTTNDNYCYISSLTRLSELADFASEFRTLASGTGTLSMRLLCYQRLTESEQRKAIQLCAGF